MTSETPNLHVLKNLNISKTAKDIEKMKTPLRLVWKCCSDAFQIGSTIFRRRGTLKGAFNFYKILEKKNAPPFPSINNDRSLRFLHILAKFQT